MVALNGHLSAPRLPWQGGKEVEERTPERVKEGKER